MNNSAPYIGQMDRKILIFEETKARNTVGEEKPTPSTIAEPYAYMQERSGSEDVEGKVRHLISRSYTIRYNATVLEKGTRLKLTDNSQTFNVYHIKELGRKKHLELLVTDYE